MAEGCVSQRRAQLGKSSCGGMRKQSCGSLWLREGGECGLERSARGSRLQLQAAAEGAPRSHRLHLGHGELRRLPVRLDDELRVDALLRRERWRRRDGRRSAQERAAGWLAGKSSSARLGGVTREPAATTRTSTNGFASLRNSPARSTTVVVPSPTWGSDANAPAMRPHSHLQAAALKRTNCASASARAASPSRKVSLPLYRTLERSHRSASFHSGGKSNVRMAR